MPPPLKPDNDETKPDPGKETIPILSTEQLFQGERELLIEHGGEYYRLRITRRNKLILQK